MNRRSVDSYAAFWLAGVGFLWWPFLLVLVVMDRRPFARRPVALLVTTGCLVASLFVAAAFQAPIPRLLGASANLTVWITLCLVISRSWDRTDVDGLARGIVDLAAVQGVLVVIARSIYPAFMNTTLPLARLLPASLAADPNVSSFSTVRLAVPDYYGRVVIRTAGIFGNPTWAGAFAAVAILLVLFAGDSLGPKMSRLPVRVVVIGLSAYTLYFSYARVDVIALIVAVVAVVAMKTRRFVEPSMWIASVCLVVGLTVVVLPALPLQSWFGRLNSQRQGSLVAREDIYGPTLKEVMAAPTPVGGAGIKTRVDGLVASLGTHSTYLGLAYRGGLVCSLSFVVFLLTLGARGFDQDAELAVGLACFLLLFGITDDFDSGHLVPLAAVLAFGLIAARRPDRSSIAPDRAAPSRQPTVTGAGAEQVITGA
ncbi:MAG: hypothetical protein M3137_11760 [Actinomycetota bacterium]|nr:hypothetical protein [Actinomycetota bacterium]